MLNVEENQNGTKKEFEDTTKTRSYNSYPKIFALGHKCIQDLFKESVIIEEKIDGSQFSFGKFKDAATGEEYLRCRSKGAQINVYAPDGMFKKGVEFLQTILPNLTLGWTYRGEYLLKPKHNVLAYDRTPNNNIILFDIATDLETYLSPEEKATEAARIGLEVVPILYSGLVETPQNLRKLLDKISILGGQKVEGIVIKNYTRFGLDGKNLMGKFVSEAFKEVHTGDWRERNPKQNDILTGLIEKYRTPTRWNKAVQHLKEAGQLTNEPRDIGIILPEISKDIQEECEEEIRDILIKWAWPHIRRGVSHGFAEWYKEELMKLQFDAIEPGEDEERAEYYDEHF